MTAIRNPEFRDELEPTRYPFGENATLRNSEGRFFLEGTFLGAAIYPVGGADRFYISQVTITHVEVTITIGDSAVDSLCSGTFDLVDLPSLVRLTDAFGRTAGVLVSEPDRLAVFQTWGVGEHNFTVEQTELVAECCYPVPGVGLRGILLDDGSVLYGDVWLVGDDGVVLRQETITVPGPCGEDPVTQTLIRVDVVGDPLFRRRLCDPDDLFETPQFVRKLTFVQDDYSFEAYPDEAGNIQILVGDSLSDSTVLRLRNTQQGLVFEVAGAEIGKVAS